MIGYLVENLPQCDWWPYHAVPEGGYDSLWFPCSPADEPVAIQAVVQASSHLRWFAMATSHHRAQAPSDLSSRFPGLVRTVFASDRSEANGDLISSTIWCEIDPISEHFLDAFSMSRRSRGSGVCIALANESVSPSGWRAASMGMLWRAPLALSPNKPQTYGIIDEMIVSASLKAMIDFGFLPFIPLDLHPSAGFVLLARISDLAPIVESFSISDSVEVLEALVARGGGAAL